MIKSDLTPESLKSRRLLKAVIKIEQKLVENETSIAVSEDLINDCLKIFRDAGFDCYKAKTELLKIPVICFNFEDRPSEQSLKGSSTCFGEKLEKNND